MSRGVCYNALPVAIVIVLQWTREFSPSSYRIFYHAVWIGNKYSNQGSYSMDSLWAQLILSAYFFVNVKHGSVNAHLSNVYAAVWIAPPSKFEGMKCFLIKFHSCQDIFNL